jgi:hypothetical protein
MDEWDSSDGASVALSEEAPWRGGGGLGGGKLLHWGPWKIC